MKLQWRDLNGPEKRVLFKEMDVPTTFPNLSRAKDIQDIWKTATELFNKLSLDNLSSTQINQFQLDVKAWVKAFLKVYHTKHITPYIHCFAMHVPEFMHMYRNLSTFSQQGLEKLNDITTAHLFRRTNHKDTQALKQLIEKQCQIEALEASGCRREKLVHKCRSCGETGHNKRTCSKRQPLQVVNQ